MTEEEKTTSNWSDPATARTTTTNSNNSAINIPSGNGTLFVRNSSDAFRTAVLRTTSSSSGGGLTDKTATSRTRTTTHHQLIPDLGQTRVPLHVHHSQINGSSQHGPLTFERKSLLAATSVTVIGLILMLVAVSTDYWLIITNPGGAYISSHRVLRMSSHSGIFRICTIDSRNETPNVAADPHCERHILFPTDHEANNLKHKFDRTSLDYTRSEVAFSTIGIILMLIGQVFAFYSFKERRYMFKRITACLHILSATCVLICIEVLVSSVTYEQDNLPFRHPVHSEYHFGFSFDLACVTCAAFFIAGIIFGIFSRKRKEPKLQTEMTTFDDEVEQQNVSLVAGDPLFNA